MYSRVHCIVWCKTCQFWEYSTFWRWQPVSKWLFVYLVYIYYLNCRADKCEWTFLCMRCQHLFDDAAVTKCIGMTPNQMSQHSVSLFYKWVCVWVMLYSHNSHSFVFFAVLQKLNFSTRAHGKQFANVIVTCGGAAFTWTLSNLIKFICIRRDVTLKYSTVCNRKCTIQSQDNHKKLQRIHVEMCLVNSMQFAGQISVAFPRWHYSVIGWVCQIQKNVQHNEITDSDLCVIFLSLPYIIKI